MEDIKINAETLQRLVKTESVLKIKCFICVLGAIMAYTNIIVQDTEFLFAGFLGGLIIFSLFIIYAEMRTIKCINSKEFTYKIIQITAHYRMYSVDSLCAIETEQGEKYKNVSFLSYYAYDVGDKAIAVKLNKYWSKLSSREGETFLLPLIENEEEKNNYDLSCELKHLLILKKRQRNFWIFILSLCLAGLVIATKFAAPAITFSALIVSMSYLISLFKHIIKIKLTFFTRRGDYACERLQIKQKKMSRLYTEQGKFKVPYSVYKDYNVGDYVRVLSFNGKGALNKGRMALPKENRL